MNSTVVQEHLRFGEPVDFVYVTKRKRVPIVNLDSPSLHDYMSPLTAAEDITVNVCSEQPVVVLL